MYNKIKRWYKAGLWTEQMVATAVTKGWITQAEYEEIIAGTPMPHHDTATELLNIIVGTENN